MIDVKVSDKIAALQEKYKNEDCHSKWVTKLALQLFDYVAAECGFTKRDRDILETASALHDIGYSVNPSMHSIESAKIVLEEDIGDFTPEERELIAAVIQLHPKELNKVLKNPYVRVAHDKTKTLGLGAILRIADGLDHGHVQDTEIVAIKRSFQSILVQTQARWYPWNTAWADQKAEIWRSIMPCGINFTQNSVNNKGFKGLIFKDDNSICIMRKLLYSQSRYIQHYRSELLYDEDNEEALHELRLATRRFRSVLHMFPLLTEVAKFTEIEKQLLDLLEKLGVVRDAQLWVIELEELKFKKKFMDDVSRKNLLLEAKAMKKIRNASLRKILKSASMNKLTGNIIDLLRIEMPELIRRHEYEIEAKKYIIEQLQTKYTNILEQKEHLDMDDSEAIHAFRVKCRELRYWVEFSSPVIEDPRWDKIGKIMTKSASALGCVHDYDIRLGYVAQSEFEVSRKIKEYLCNKRSKAFEKFRKQWSKLDK